MKEKCSSLELKLQEANTAMEHLQTSLQNAEDGCNKAELELSGRREYAQKCESKIAELVEKVDYI